MSSGGPANPVFPKLTLILGGARSGKSSWAEGFVDLSGKAPVYLATGRPVDAEMAERIARHRENRGDDWRTIEAPLEVANALYDATAEDCVLLDCATFWLSNLMMDKRDIDTAREDLIRALRGCGPSVVVVSNEVGHGVVPENALARRFRDAQGVLNARLAAAAELVVFVTAGLPSVLKGKLPELPA